MDYFLYFAPFSCRFNIVLEVLKHYSFLSLTLAILANETHKRNSASLSVQVTVQIKQEGIIDCNGININQYRIVSQRCDIHLSISKWVISSQSLFNAFTLWVSHCGFWYCQNEKVPRSQSSHPSWNRSFLDHQVGFTNVLQHRRGCYKTVCVQR